MKYLQRENSRSHILLKGVTLRWLLLKVFLDESTLISSNLVNVLSSLVNMVVLNTNMTSPFPASISYLHKHLQLNCFSTRVYSSLGGESNKVKYSAHEFWKDFLKRNNMHRWSITFGKVFGKAPTVWQIKEKTMTNRNKCIVHFYPTHYAENTDKRKKVS